MKKTAVYSLQNVAIHAARGQLEKMGILDPRTGLDQIRDMAAEINGGIQSVSRLSLKQREVLIQRLIEKGARVRNPHIYASDLASEAALGGSRKILSFSRVTERQLRMLDTLATQIFWQGPDAYERLCVKLFNASVPRNNKEATQLATILRSMIQQQRVRREGS
jgi:hypothetical protein